MAAQYWLASHVHLGVCGHYIVLFDTNRGKYLAVDGVKADRLASRIVGWPLTQRLREDSSPAGVSDSQSERAAEKTIAEFLRANLLTLDPGRGKSAQPTAIAPPGSSFEIFDLERSLRPHLRYLRSFLLACSRAKLRLRSLRMGVLIDRLSVRKAAWGDSAQEPEKLRRLVRAHHHLRPLVYTAHDACLFDSLVLVEFLAIYKVSVTWIFGVYPAPFGPHCWVQAGSIVLNDTVGHVLHYSPILAI
jgi:hypothetical protein